MCGRCTAAIRRVTSRSERPGRALLLPAGVAAALLVGGIARFLEQHRTAHAIWAAPLLVVGVPPMRSVVLAPCVRLGRQCLGVHHEHGPPCVAHDAFGDRAE